MDEPSILPAKEPVMLPAEDRNRMSRLYEEVRTRLEEMAMITARTLRMSGVAGSEAQFSPLATGADGEFLAVELIRTSQSCGCYDYGRGACFEFERAGREVRPAFSHLER